MIANYTRMNNLRNTRMNDVLRANNSPAYSSRMDIGTRLDQAMEKAHFKTQAALADASGVPQPTIARILKGGGKRGPETTTIQKLAAACGVTFNWLMEGANKPIETTSMPAKPAAQKNEPTVSLSYITDEELELLTQYRQSTTKSQQLLRNFAERADKDPKKMRLLVKKVVR